MSPTPLYTIAWQGCSLQIPGGPDGCPWNLTRYQGNSRFGQIALADLAREQIELKWHQVKPRRFEGQVAALVRHLGRQHGNVSSAPFRQNPSGATAGEMRGWWIQIPPGRVHPQLHAAVLIQAPPPARRVYELTGHSRGAVETAARNLRDHTADPFWPWELYGLRGRVPRALRLQKILLQPGRTQLDFSDRRFYSPGCRGKVSLGSWSLADRLLAGRPLPQWARDAIPLVRQNLKTATEIPTLPPVPDTGAVQETFRFPTRSGLLRRRRQTILQLTHEPVSNVIRWLQIAGPPGWTEQVLTAQTEEFAP